MVNKKLKFDIATRGVTPRADAVQGESSGARVIDLAFTKDGAPWVIPSGSAIEVRYKRGDGAGGSYQAAADSDGPTLHLPVKSDLTDAAGVTDVSVLISSGGATIGVFPLQIIVAPDPSGGASHAMPPVEKFQYGSVAPTSVTGNAKAHHVNFLHAFSEPPSVSATPVITTIGGTQQQLNTLVSIDLAVSNITATGFDVYMRVSGSAASGIRSGVSWIAYGL